MRPAKHQEMTDHALRRCQQRGIPSSIVRTLLDHHDLDRDVGSGCRVLRVSRRQARGEGRKLGPQVARRLESLAVIWSDVTGQVVTVFRDDGTHRRYAARA